MRITGGELNGRKIQAPDESIVRPTLSKVRMSVFNILFSLLGDFKDCSFLDVFGGSGIMGIEALSRGFKKAVVFEKNKMVAQIIKNNYKTLGLTPNLVVGDSLKLLKKQKEEFDVVYIDPPYMSGIYEKCLENIPSSKVVILEHVVEVDTNGFEIIKQKKYGDKFLTFLRRTI
jgi:16S rRNA (guanine(966)-N(2))-methyltransferase RsmD